MTTKITEQNISNLANAGVQWQAVKTSDFTAVAGEGYFVDTTSAAVEVTLPSSPSVGDTIAIKDYAGTFGTNSLNIARNGNNIQGVTNDGQISTNRASVILVYIDTTKGWLFTNESNVASLGKPTFISATGGTITTSGDYKIHTFTGDDCFVVSSLGGNGTPCGAASTVDYLVVAGGGGSGSCASGGGGAGGYRANYPSSCCGFTITATTYPITVGAGGSAGPAATATQGSNSVFSTITSTGGGTGKGGASPVAGGSGGSGGGAGGGGTGVSPGGSGNTPPTSPSQGNPGGTNCSSAGVGAAAGGGGGIGSPGSNGTSSPTYDSGSGGNGSGIGINPSPSVGTPGPSAPLRYFSGGGGGSEYTGALGGAPGGYGGGGDGGGSGTDGTANTGGGAGGTSVSQAGRNGGKGIVILRYKFQ
jgi:hypothetical protein